MADSPPQLYYVGDAGRYYPSLGLSPEPGQGYGVADGLPTSKGGKLIAPDERWTDDVQAADEAADAHEKAVKADEAVTNGAEVPDEQEVAS